MSLQYTSYFIGGGGENVKAASLLFTMQILELEVKTSHPLSVSCLNAVEMLRLY